jgi:hypothetical protein
MKLELTYSLPDAEVLTMDRIRSRVPLHRRWLHDRLRNNRKEQVYWGIYGINAPGDWIQARLQTLDPYLRLRWDADRRCYVLERILTDMRCWVTLTDWIHSDGTARRIGTFQINEMIQMLHEGDMRRFSSPEKYLQYKREKAEFRRQQLERESDDRVRAAVDSLTDRQINNFVNVEKAIAGGEKIRAYGKDAEYLNRIWDNQKRGYIADIPSSHDALNPGAQPGVYQRYPQKVG